MTKAEIVVERPKLSAEDRAKIRAPVPERAVRGWLDDSVLADEEKRLLDARLDECERNPSSFVPWEEAKARIMASLRK